MYPADLPRYLRRESRAAIGRLAADVKHACRAREISGAGGGIDARHLSKQSRGDIENPDVAGVQNASVGGERKVIGVRESARVWSRSEAAGEDSLGRPVKTSPLGDCSARRPVSIINNAQIAFGLFAVVVGLCLRCRQNCTTRGHK